MLAFITTFVSPHTLPLGVELSKYYEKVVFINTAHLTQERAKLGYDVSDSRVDILSFSDNQQECRRIIEQAKTVILAGIRFDLVESRVQQGKPVFLAHERLLKKGAVKLLDPRTWKIAKFCLSVREKPVYLLAIGDNAARDFRLLGFNSRNIYRFGYFPEVGTYMPEQLKKTCDGYKVLWVGRFVGFKRPLMALKAFRNMGSEFELTMVGDGALLEQATAYAKKHGMTVKFTGRLPAAEVERHMLESHILMSTSHKGEGWGAVINEGMSRGCAIVCSRAIGCAGSLATGENAVLFATHSIRDLRRALKECAARQEELAQQGYKTVTNEFNAVQAARRLATLADAQGESPWQEGLCSRFF